MMPCTRQENVSRMLAVFRRSRWKRWAMSLAIGPVVIMAMVLFAVQRLAMLTSAAMLSSESGKEYTITYVIDEKGLNDAIGLELVTTYTAGDGKQHVYSVEPFSVVKKEGNLYTFQVKHKLENAGSFKVSYRMFPKNSDLPHRQDFCYVRWFV